MMNTYNVTIVYDERREKLLMCRRSKEPYKDLLNFVGGKKEPGETSEEAAYRELFEETGITKEDIKLTHVMDFRYCLSELELEVYAGRLHGLPLLIPEANELVWVGRDEDFCDDRRFAGDCNIEHILRQVDFYADTVLE